LGLQIGLGWAKAKSHRVGTGQCRVPRYNRRLMMAIQHNKVAVAKAVNVTVLPLVRMRRAATTPLIKAVRRSSCWTRMGS
jgi:hypothetical protein